MVLQSIHRPSTDLSDGPKVCRDAPCLAMGFGEETVQTRCPVLRWKRILVKKRCKNHVQIWMDLNFYGLKNWWTPLGTQFSRHTKSCLGYLRSCIGHSDLSWGRPGEERQSASYVPGRTGCCHPAMVHWLVHQWRAGAGGPRGWATHLKHISHWGSSSQIWLENSHLRPPSHEESIGEILRNWLKLFFRTPVQGRTQLWYLGCDKSSTCSIFGTIPSIVSIGVSRSLCPLKIRDEKGLVNNVLLVKIEGPVWYTIYHHLPVVKGVCPNPSINQPTNGKRTSMGLVPVLHENRFRHPLGVAEKLVPILGGPLAGCCH